MIVIPGPASTELGEKISEYLGVDSFPVNYRLFPDGESYIRIEPNIKEKTVVIVQTTAPNGDRKLVQLLMIASTARDYGAKRVIAVVPYLGYSRQDKRFLKGEALTLDVILSLLEKTGVSDLLVVDIHNEESIREIEKNHSIKVHNLSAVPTLAMYLKESDYMGAYSLSPDKGAVHLAEKASKVLEGGYSFFEKKRDRRTGEIEMLVTDLNIEGKKAVVIDDIISSGGTMAKAIKGLKEQGALQVAAVCSHALFMPGAEERLLKAGADIVVTSDTVENQYSKISVAKIIKEHLEKI
jgi:ribose-phosphate pyrophosphokinase